jgi:hypothetical protein
LLSNVSFKGGFTANYVSTSFLYNQTSKTWNNGPNLPVINGFHCMVKISPTSFMLIGGSINPNDVWMVDWTSKTWTQKPDLSIGRSQMGCFQYTFQNGSQVVFTVGEFVPMT